MHKNTKTVFSVLSLALTLLFVTSCSDPLGATEDRPAIPIPDSYEADVPEKSDELVVGEARSNYFNPSITEYTLESGTTVDVNSLRVLLVNDGTTVSPVDGNDDYLSLESDEIPYLQLVRYWQRVGDVESYAGGSTTTITREVTQGSSESSTTSFTESISVEVESEAGGLFASASVSASTSFTSTQEFSSTESTETTETWSFSVSPESGTNMTYTVWQLVEEFRFVDSEGNLYDTPKYEFDEDSLRFVYPTNEIVPVSAYYN